MDKLWAMEMFVRVAECASFSRAAESLDLANATVTAGIRNLERHLKVTLINRDTRRFRLSEEGEKYLAHCRDILAHVARAEDEVSAQLAELRGQLHVETTISIGHALLVPRLAEFTRRFPEIRVAVTLTNLPFNVIERATDVAIRLGHVEDADLVARPLADISYVLCCAPVSGRNVPAHPRELDPRQCIGHVSSDRRSLMSWKLSRGDEVVEIRPDGPLAFNSSDDVLVAAREGLGYAYVLDVLAQRHFANGSLVRVCEDWTTTIKTLYVVIPKSRVGSAKVKAFTDFVFEQVGRAQAPDLRQKVGVKMTGRR